MVGIFILVLFCFLTVTLLLVANQQRNLLYRETDKHAVENLEFMADASIESLLKSDYVTVRTFVTRWGKSHEDIRKILVVATNGFVIAEYQSPSTIPGEIYSLSKQVDIEKMPIATIHLSGDYRYADMAASQLQQRLLFASFIITALLGTSLWITFRRLAIAPLEHMVEERTRALSVTNQELEEEMATRIKAERDLREREEHLDQILNSISEGIYEIDLEGNCTYCNPAALQILGYSDRRDVIGKPMHQLIHYRRMDGSAYPASECAICRCFRTGEGCHSDDEIFWRSDGTYFPVEYWSQPTFRNTTLFGAVTAFVDITERRQAEAGLREQEEELSSIFRNAPYLMILLDKNRSIIHGNIAAFQHSEKSATEVIGSRVGETIRCINSLSDPEGCGFGPNCNTCLLRSSILDTMETGRNHYEREVEMMISDQGPDKKITVLITTTRLFIRHQPMVLVSIHEITETKRLEAQLRQAQKMESIGQFAGGIAHDFNNILTVILGYGEMLQMTIPKDDIQRQYLEHIIEAGNRASHLTKDLLLFSRKQILERKHVDLNVIIKKLEKFLVRIIGEDIVFTLRLSEGEVPVFADENLLQQVLMNFATNARDAMTGGGSFTISTELLMQDEEFVSAHGFGSPGKYALICISDTGKGMNEETRQRIFEPFFTTKEVGKGTGLGLAVTFGIIKQHDGFINVYSEQGIGTTFRVYLPAIEFFSPEEKATVIEEQPLGGTETILFAEDDENVRGLTEKTLKDFGYTVITAVDGEDAVNKYKEYKDRIQLLLFDFIMPKKTGKEAYDEIRKIRPDIKTIFVTGYSPDIVSEKASIGSDATIVFKPISRTNLLKKIRSVLDKKNT